MNIVVAVTSEERAACFGLRERVFVQEQGVPRTLEIDDLDAHAVHFLLRDDATGEALATARLLDKGAGTAKIGRVAVRADRRSRGLGREIMQAVLAEAQGRGFAEAVLDSQTYAVPFYTRLGFVAEGEEFPDAGIPHITMRLRL